MLETLIWILLGPSEGSRTELQLDIIGSKGCLQKLIRWRYLSIKHVTWSLNSDMLCCLLQAAFFSFQTQPMSASSAAKHKLFSVAIVISKIHFNLKLQCVTLLALIVIFYTQFSTFMNHFHCGETVLHFFVLCKLVIARYLNNNTRFNGTIWR